MSEETPRKRGRPPGSIGLTAEKQEQLLTLVRGGATLKDAAWTVGIPLRTIQEWVARGEGRSAKSATPKLRKFAEALARAQGEAKVSAQVRLHQHQPGPWLKNAASELATAIEQTNGEETSNPQLIRELAKKLRDLLLYTDPTEVVPSCTNRRCRCVFHRERGPQELAAMLELASKGATT